MSFQEYLSHYLDGGRMLVMLVIAAFAVFLSVLIIYLFSNAKARREGPDSFRENGGAEEPELGGVPLDEIATADMSPAQLRVYRRKLAEEREAEPGGKRPAAIRKKDASGEFMSLTERYYELIFSATSILLFVGIYFSIDYFGTGASMRGIWDEYGDFILLFFILASVVFTSIMDNVLIPLSHVKKGERATMRLAGMLYMIVIFIYIKFFYQDSNYDSIILYFLTLVIGRFVYFDASLESFHDAMRDVFLNLPLLALALLSTAIIAAFGFRTGYLLTVNGVVLNLFIGHLYLLAVIFVVHNVSRAAQRRKARR